MDHKTIGSHLELSFHFIYFHGIHFQKKHEDGERKKKKKEKKKKKVIYKIINGS